MVRARNQRDQVPDDGIRRGGALGVAQDHRVHVDALALPESLVGRKEEGAATKDRSTERPSELVAIERVRSGC
jgi:hypothetical protein